MCNIRHISQAAPGDRLFLRGLVEACIHHFLEFRGAGAGVAGGSCCAAMKFGPGPQDYVYGHSQAHNLDPDAPHQGGIFNPQHHAERVVYQQAVGHNSNPPPHLFVELPPCPGVNGCNAWLQANTPANFNVWYLYGDGEAMRIAHELGVETELATIYGILG